MQINPGRGFIGDSAVTPHTPYASTLPVWGARVRCMRAVIVVVVVFCFYCVVSYRPSYSLSSTSAFVVESGFKSSRPLVKTGHIPGGLAWFWSVRSVFMHAL